MIKRTHVIAAWNDYSSLSSEELERKIDYDTYLMKQPSLHTRTHQKIAKDRLACEEELKRRGLWL